MSFIFRAYHAMARQRPMSTKTGVPTAATYVFVNMLNKLRDDFAPKYLAAVFDLAGPTFRDEQAREIKSVQKFDIKTQQFQSVDYHGYKANRKETPPDLNQQIPYIRRALDAYRIPVLSQQGFEADDVLGTLARQAADRGHEVFVVSSDKDMLQLVSDHICVLNPPKDNLICDAAKVEEIVGVPPRQVIDVMALRGDSIDNVPGAPGIGEKGSVEIIRRFGSVEAALDHAAEIEKKSYRESLQNNRDVVLLSKKLVTIDQHVDLELDLDAMRAQEPDVLACQALFKELEFTTLLRSVLPQAAPADLGETDYKDISSVAELKPILAEAKKSPAGLAVAFAVTPKAVPAIETPEEAEPAPEPAATSGDLFAAPAATAAVETKVAAKVGLSAQPGKAVNADETVAALALADAALPKSVHDYKSALHHAAGSGDAIAGVKHDTLLYSYLLDPTTSSHSLPDLAMRRYDVRLTESLAQSADVIGRLAAALRKEVEAEEMLAVYETIDLPLAPVLMRMERAGVKIDSDVLSELSRRLTLECATKAKEIHQLAGVEFNINSPKKLGEVLFEKLNLPKPIKYGRGKTISTAVDVLEELAASSGSPVPRMVLDYRQISKLKSTYVEALPQLVNAKTGRLHTTYNAAATATGRLSSVNPNLQNIPIRTEQGREIRAAFIADKGNLLLAADYSQIELRLLAHYSEDPLLTEAFKRGDDIHTLTAAEVFGVPRDEITAEHRRRAKAVNFGIVYGLSPFGLSQQLGIDTKVAKTYIDNYFAKYAGVKTFIDRTLNEVRSAAKVRTLFGRVRPIPDINSQNFNMRGFADRTAVNTPLQGTAADLIKIAMIRIDEELTRRKLATRMTLQVHDELVFEVPESELEEVRALVCDKMENVHPLRVPLVVDVGVGKNWRDLD
jgi:DNA polymerase-1